MKALAADARLELVAFLSARRLFTRCNLLLKLLYSLDIVRVLMVFRNRSRWHLCLLENFLAMCACFRLKLALLLHLPLYFALLSINEILRALEVLRDTFFHWLEPLAHFFGLPAHRFRLKRAARRLFKYPLFLHINDAFTGLFRLPEVGLMIGRAGWLAFSVGSSTLVIRLSRLLLWSHFQH